MKSHMVELRLQQRFRKGLSFVAAYAYSNDKKQEWFDDIAQYKTVTSNGNEGFDYNPKNTIAHYSAFRRIDMDALRKQYAEAKALSPSQALKGSPLAPGRGLVPLPRFFAVESVSNGSAESVIAGLNKEGYWIVPLGMNSHSYRCDGSTNVPPAEFSQTHVGDETDTSPFSDDKIVGISTEAYIRNMSVLIRSLQ